MRLLLLVCLLVAARAQQQGGDLSSLLEEVFGKPTQVSPVTPGIDANQEVDLNPTPSKRPTDNSCTTGDGQAGECVAYYLCSSNNTIINDGVGVIDIRVRDGPCESYLEICCLPPDRLSVPITPANPVNGGTTNTGGGGSNTGSGSDTGSGGTSTGSGSDTGSGGTNTGSGGNTAGGDSTGGGSFNTGGSGTQAGGGTNVPDRGPNNPGGGTDADNNVLPNKPIKPGCGWRNPDGVGFRIKGDVDNEAKFGEFPWMVAVLKLVPVDDEDPNSETLNVYVCGGSLIHPSVVLTAAHCVHNVQVLKARAGEWDTQTTNEIYPYQDRDVVDVKIHKDFNAGNLFYDIALLFLSKPMTLAPNVGLACLPEPKNTAAPGAPCFASGWGKDQFGKEGRYQVILKKIQVPAVNKRDCQEKLRSTRLGRYFNLHHTFMCAGGEQGKDTCKGDGGSPLICPAAFEDDRYIQNGIVAWGIGCGENGVPGVYVDVAQLRPWIDNEIIAKRYGDEAIKMYSL